MKKKKIGNIKIHAKKKIAIIKKKKMLSLLLIIPLIGSLFIMPIQEDSELNKLKMKNDNKFKETVISANIENRVILLFSNPL